MSTVIIIHGTCDQEEYFSDQYPALSNSHWVPWLQKQFLIRGHHAYTPEMPLAYAPDYERWSEEFERLPISEESILIGHSCGGGFLLRWLSETKRRVARLVLVAPWLDPESKKCPEFFAFQMDEHLAERVEVHLLESTNDSDDIKASVQVIHSALPQLHRHTFRDYGHFCFSDMRTSEFPELRAIALG